MSSLRKNTKTNIARLQRTYFKRNGFDFKFLCDLSPTTVTSNDMNTPNHKLHS